MYLQCSSFSLNERIAANMSLSKLATISPLMGLGVRKYLNII